VVGSTVVGLTGILFFFVLLWGYLDAKREPILGVVLLAYALRTVAYGLHRSLMPSLYTERLYPFEPTGWAWASEGADHVWASFTFGPDFYSWLISVVYLVLPRSSMFIAAINVFLSAAVVYLVYKIVAHYAGHRTGYWAAIVVAIFPVTLLQTIILSREMLITFFLTAACWHLIKFSTDSASRRLIYGIVCLAVASAPHTGVLVASLLALAFLSAYAGACLLWRFHRRGPNTAFSQRGLLTATTVGLLVVGSGIGAQSIWTPLSGAKVSALFAAENPLTPILEVYNSGNRGKAGYPPWLFTTEPLQATFLLPVRIVYFLFSPFVWMVDSVRHVAGLLNGIAMVFAFYYTSAFFLQRTGDRSYALLFIGALLFFFVAVFAVGVKNFGQAFRHRAKILPVLVALGGVAFSAHHRIRGR
jgi:hypothetical protein